MKTISVLLARGGSKGIPKKNIIPVKGRPLLAYTLEASKQSCVEETWVSTDCPEIASVAKKFGAKILIRPAELATDISKSEDALIHFCEEVESDCIVFIQPTSPLLKPIYINEGVEMMYKYDSVFSVCREHWIPRWTLDGQPHQWNLSDRPRRQDKEELFLENGAFYISYRQAILDSGLRYSGKIGMVEMPYSESFQVDTQDDLALIEKLL